MLISVAMAVHNGEMYLQEAIDGLQAQTYKKMEVVIVNDGSTDRTRNILDQIQDRRFRVFHLPKNRGAANALNVAIRMARGEWIAIHDADDISHPDRLAKQAKYIHKHPGHVAVGSLIQCILGKSPLPRQLLQSTELAFNSYVTPKQIKEGRFSACPLCHGSVVFSKQAYIKAGGYNPQYKIAYDYDLWTRLIDLGPIGKVNKVLYHYRVHASSLSNKKWTDTYDEKLRSALISIRKICYGDAIDSPRFAVFAPQWLCSNLKRIIVPATGCRVSVYIHGNYVLNIPKVIDWIAAQKLDGVLISVMIDKAAIQQMTESFQAHGMEINRTLFTV
ncbi:glycosyltransferase [Paenibacillus mesophilus]|uniref:glycosyltransferase family 2 protein n=1 Tax=Paenibacillus mesophilus TaxID=2582849 RepID=UPI00110E53EF|nr:glycosyltransferase [Paenibacillus mesophilus]TMV50003.1 glycosyltransferase [Paenibacillus mesophilus]